MNCARSLRTFFGHQRALSKCINSISRKGITVEHRNLGTVVSDGMKRKASINIAARQTPRSDIFSSGPSFCFKVCGQRDTLLHVRFVKTKSSSERSNVAYYVIAMVISMVGMSYAGVPLFKIFCQQFGLGGNTEIARQENTDKVVAMEKVPDRKIEVRFIADRASNMRWNFRPQQDTIEVSPGETALAFYTAQNPTDKPIIGVATYTVVPYQAAVYFHKIQCFCFEEQILNPHEQVDMPVFFYIDPEYDDDPELARENRIVLSYTFFEAKEGMSLPIPGYN